MALFLYESGTFHIGKVALFLYESGTFPIWIYICVRICFLHETYV